VLFFETRWPPIRRPPWPPIRFPVPQVECNNCLNSSERYLAINRVYMPIPSEISVVIDKLLPLSLEGFGRVKFTSKNSMIYRRDILPNLAFFVLVVPAQYELSFTFELAWSDSPEFPFNAPGRSPVSSTGQYRADRLAAPQGRVRVGHLSGARGDLFWKLGGIGTLEKFKKLLEDGIHRNPTSDFELPAAPPPNIENIITDALTLTKRVGLPFFEAVLAAHSA
jgi:hypothetical protein